MVEELVETSILSMLIVRAQWLDGVLITGGTGSFGRAFTRVLLDQGCERVVIYSRDEAKQQAMNKEFNDRRLRFILGDVRDVDQLERACSGVPIVIHAAALKQVDRSMDSFDEFVKTNILGSLNVVAACHRAGVQHCIGLSTDKACASSTPYGASKSAMEWAFIGGNAWGPCKFALVRYGNVVGSRGSVYELWAKRYAQGEPLPVTDYDMTRFWLPIEAAVDLVFLAMNRMHGGEIFIPKDVPSSSLCEKAREWFPECVFNVIGKRAYEKLHESLVSREEADRCHDCGDVYVLLPHSRRWGIPYGETEPLVPKGFQYTSEGGAT